MRPAAPSPEEIAAKMDSHGGWPRDVLESWGVPFPPPKGWKRDLERRYAEEHGLPMRVARAPQPRAEPPTKRRLFVSLAVADANFQGLYLTRKEVKALMRLPPVALAAFNELTPDERAMPIHEVEP